MAIGYSPRNLSDSRVAFGLALGLFEGAAALGTGYATLKLIYISGATVDTVRMWGYIIVLWTFVLASGAGLMFWDTLTAMQERHDRLPLSASGDGPAFDDQLRGEPGNPERQDKADGDADGPPGEDRTRQPASGGAIVCQLLRLATPDWPFLCIGFTALAAAAATGTAIPWFTGKVVASISAGEGAAVYQQPLIALAVLAGLTGLFAGLRGGCMTIAVARLKLRMRRRLFDSLLRQDVGFFNENSTGELLSRLSADTTKVGDSVGLTLNVLLRTGLQLIGTLGLMFFISWRLTLVVLLIVPVVLWVGRIYGAILSRIARDTQTALAVCNTVAEQCIGAMPTVASFAGQRSERDRHSRGLGLFYDVTLLQSFTYGIYAMIWNATPSIVTAATLLVGGELVEIGELEASLLYSFVLYATTVSGLLSTVADMVSNIMQAVGAVEKVLQLIARQPAFEENGNLQLAVDGQLLATPADPIDPERADCLGRRVVSAWEREMDRHDREQKEVARRLSALHKLQLAAGGDDEAGHGHVGRTKKGMVEQLLREMDEGDDYDPRVLFQPWPHRRQRLRQLQEQFSSPRVPGEGMEGSLNACPQATAAAQPLLAASSARHPQAAFADLALDAIGLAPGVESTGRHGNGASASLPRPLSPGTDEQCLGRIELRDVSFRYPNRPHHPVLDGFSLVVEPSQMVALVGPSGGGKSTVVKLLQRFFEPETGSILLDGRPLSAYEHRWRHRAIATVGQEPVLFARSVFDNVAFGMAEELAAGVLRPQHIGDAIRMANAASFVSRMPEGIWTDVNERGSALSGGQKQRVAIARAIVRKPRVLLLDEATSALDAESERLVQQSLDQLMQQRRGGPSVVVIAHRLSTVRHADKIAVVDGGRVVQQGTHEELLADRAGLYATLVGRQVGRV